MVSKSVERIKEMEEIFDEATHKLNNLENAIRELCEYQSEIEKLEAYYTGDEWKEDYSLDEEGKLPSDLKRGMLSEDGIFDLLERVKELKQR